MITKAKNVCVVYRLFQLSAERSGTGEAKGGRQKYENGHDSRRDWTTQFLSKNGSVCEDKNSSFDKKQNRYR
jgi:hypothetical protein